MQFVTGGLDIPERLLQAHEDGRVVFFCGAGISYPARLPGFQRLVERLYADLSVTPDAVQRTAIRKKHFDTAVGLLEERHVGGRKRVREALADILLKPDLVAPNATATHDALLTLSRDRRGQTRLITTNFDRLFEEVIETIGRGVERFRAPLLPVPKSRWDGLVYLHGLLDDTPDEDNLNSLVVSSGDFRRAYLTERWAARFVGELFRNFTVCFVGYSIDDPVLRYMMDALAADRLLGESTPEMFAFGSYSRGKESDCADEWAAKNVSPVLYRQHWRHAYLHRTLRAWADTYRDGLRGKERIVTEGATVGPQASTTEDDFVGRVIWALSDPSGVPARRFTEQDPVPTLEWLEPLAQTRFGHGDLARFGVPPKSARDDKLMFSLTCRPSPYDSAPWMTLADYGARRSQWDEVMWQLARWLVRHLDDPDLLLWLVKQGGHLHNELVRMIRRQIDQLDTLASSGNTAELTRIRAGAPNAVPRPAMRTLWLLLLTGRVKVEGDDRGLHSWRKRFSRDGLTATLRLELLEKFTPCVALSEPLDWPTKETQDDEPERITNLVEWRIELSTKSIRFALKELPQDAAWRSALASLLPDFSALLRDALDLMLELQGIDEESDLSYVHQPSISRHSQNHAFQDWTALIELSRDAWLETADQSPQQAWIAAQTWWQFRYPLFRRLAFFAGAQGEVVPHPVALQWLLADECWWLWSIETRREAIRLLVALAPKLDDAELSELEFAILAGPPRDMYRADINAEFWAQIRDQEIWLRLAKANDAGAKLSPAGTRQLAKLAAQHPDWTLAEDERDEFSGWTGDSGELRKVVSTPRRRRELVEWLKEHPEEEWWHEDDWRQRCRDDFATTACTLYALSRDGRWPASRWRAALQAWSEDKLIRRSWHYMARVVANTPDEHLQPFSRGVSSWLRAVAKVFEGNETTFFTLCNRVLAFDHDIEELGDDVVTRAVNHPIGHVTQALLHWWYRRTLEDGQGLPIEVSPVFTKLCDVGIEPYVYGRVILASRVVTLFRVGPDWATRFLLPLFDWARSEPEARSAWKGFLWSPRLYRPVMDALKAQFLDTANHYAALGQHDRQYAALLTYAGLEPADVFKTGELAGAMRALPQSGLQVAAEALIRALDGAGDQRGEYWTNRVAPFMRSTWPPTRDRASQAIAGRISRVCVAAGDAFPHALKVLRPWLQTLDNGDYVVHLLQKAEICPKYPEDALTFLDLVIGEDSGWAPEALKACLAELRTADRSVDEDPRYRRLVEYLQRYGEDLN